MNNWHKQQGFTLLEMMMATMIFALVIVVGYGFWSFISRNFELTYEEARILDEATLAVNEFVSDVRESRVGSEGSYPLHTTNDQELVFYSDVDDDGLAERVRYYLNDNQLIKQVFHSEGIGEAYSCVGV